MVIHVCSKNFVKKAAYMGIPAYIGIPEYGNSLTNFFFRNPCIHIWESLNMEIV